MKEPPMEFLRLKSREILTNGNAIENTVLNVIQIPRVLWELSINQVKEGIVFLH